MCARSLSWFRQFKLFAGEKTTKPPAVHPEPADVSRIIDDFFADGDSLSSSSRPPPWAKVCYSVAAHIQKEFSRRTSPA
jgi:hypothetical protein